MISHAVDPDAQRPDNEFSGLVAQLHSRDDLTLAALIESHARERLERGLDVDLGAYLAYIDPIEAYPVSIDAALEYLLRSRGSDAIEELVAAHPPLERMIREAALLNSAIDGMSTIVDPGSCYEPERLPMEFGPVCYCCEKQYTLLEKIGEGASGVVFRAVDHVLSDGSAREEVAIKVLRRVSDGRDPGRRLEEAFKARFVKQENVIRVLSCGMERGYPFIVLEYVEGKSLWEMQEDELIDAHRAASLMMDAARGVHAAHRAGISHMDLKPQNIMIDGEGRARVTDFGVAVTTTDADAAETKRLRGTLAFMAPEQLSGAGALQTQSSDLFGLGTILILLLTGEHSTIQDNRRLLGSSLEERTETLCRRIEREHDRDIAMICRNAVAVDPEARYSSASEFEDDLRSWVERRPLAKSRTLLRRRIGLWQRRHPQLAIASYIALLIGSSCMGYMGYATYKWNQTSRSRDAAVDANSELIHMIAMTTEATKKIQNAQDAGHFFIWLWALEWEAGGALLENPAVFNNIWASRVRVVDLILAEMEAEGRTDTDEYRLWVRARQIWVDKLNDALASEGGVEASEQPAGELTGAR